MQDPTLNVLKSFALALQKSVDEVADFFADHFRDVFGEQDVKTGIAEVEAHGAQRIGKRVRLGNHDLGAARFLLAGDQHGSGAVAEKNRGDQVSLRDVFALESERRELDGDDQDVSAGIRFEEIRGAAEGHGAGSAAELGEGHAADVGAKAHQVDEMGVEGGNHESSAGHSDDQVDFIGTHAGALQTFFGGLLPELYGVFDIFLVGLIQRARFDRVFDGENSVALMD